MKVEKPKLYKIVEWTKGEHALFRYDFEDKKYYLVKKFKDKELAKEEMKRRYESVKLNKEFAEKVKNFNIRNKS